MIKTTQPKPNHAKIYVVLHNTAVSRSAQPLQYEQVNEFHRTKDWGGGWRQSSPSALGSWVGYNFFCEPTGKRYQCRLYGEETIANTGYNCDVPERCNAISYCMAGYFKVEKPTQHQINDFKDFIAEVRALYPDAEVVVVQHKDLQPGRTCAELTPEELIAIWESPESCEAKCARLERENKMLRGMVNQLIDLFMKLIKK